MNTYLIILLFGFVYFTGSLATYVLFKNFWIGRFGQESWSRQDDTFAIGLSIISWLGVVSVLTFEIILRRMGEN